MDFVNIFLMLLCVLGYYCGVSQGKKDTRSEIERIKRNKQDEKTDAEKELAIALEDATGPESSCRPYFESKRGRLDKEQLQREKRLDRERLPSEIEKLENEIVWMENLLSEISK